MHWLLARIIASVLVLSGFGWTIYASIHYTQAETTSQRLHALCVLCDQIKPAILLAAYALLQDCFPGVNRWFLLVVMAGLYALGHALWPLGL